MVTSIRWNVDADGNWNDTANWSQPRLPAASDDVAIDTLHRHTITFNTGTVTVHSLTVGHDDFVLKGGSLTLATSSNFASSLTVANATLTLDDGRDTTVAGRFFGGQHAIVTGAGDLILAGGATIDGIQMVMTGAGVTQLDGATRLASDAALNLNDRRVLENLGTLTVSGNASILLGSNPFGQTLGDCVLKNDHGAAIVFNNSASTIAVSTSFANTQFVNAGTVKDIGAGATTIDAPFISTGKLVITQGELILSDGGSLSANIEIASGATLDFKSGFERVFTLHGSGTVGSAGSTLLIDETTLAVGGDTTVMGLTIGDSFGGISGSGTLTLAGGLSLGAMCNFSMDGSGTTVLEGSSVLAGGAQLHVTNGRVLENTGTLTLSKGAAVALGDIIGDTKYDGILRNDAGATIDFGANGNANTNTSGVQSATDKITFTNAGLIEKTGTGLTAIDATIANTGAIHILESELDFRAGGVSSIHAIKIASGAILGLGSETGYSAPFELTGSGTLGGAGSTVAIDLGTVKVKHPILFGGALSFSEEGTLKLTGNNVVLGQFSASSGTITDKGTLTLAGGAAFSNDASFSEFVMSGHGVTVLQGETTLGTGQFGSDEEGLALDNGRSLENTGTLTEKNASEITGGALTNDAGATIICNNSSSGEVGFFGILDNMGSVETGGQYGLSIGYLNNKGTIAVTGGQLDLSAGTSDVSAISLQAGTTLGFLDSQSPGFTLTGGGILGSAGSHVLIQSAPLAIAAATTVAGDLTFEGGTLQLEANVTVAGQFTSSVGFESNTVVSGTDTLTLAGGATFTGHQFAGGGELMTGSGTTMLEQSTLLESADRLALDGGRILENTGSFSETDSAQIELGYNPFTNSANGAPTLGGGTFINDAGATITFDNTAIIMVVVGYQGTTAFINHGEIDNIGAGESIIAAPFTNPGKVTVGAGELEVTGPMTGTGSVSVASGASFVLDAQSTITKNVVDIASGDGHVALNGGSANDTFGFTGNFAAADAVDGGGGVNTLALDGNYSAGIVFGATTVQNVAILMLADGFSYSIATGDATVAAGQTLTVKGVALKGANTLHFDGSAETDGSFVLDGGQGNDVLHAGAGTDTLYGDLGADTLTGGAGSDTFVYKAAAESAGGSYDIITDFDASHDEIALPFTIRAIDPTQTAASLNQLPTAFDAAHLGAHHAALAIVGTNTFLVIDGNGAAGYQSGADILIDVTGMTGPLTTGSFA